MSNRSLFSLGFIIGAASGATVAWYLLKDKYETLAQEEIDSVKEVKLMLRQNIGAPCVPSVKVGDAVSVGQKIAAPPEGALGTCLHASITGTVTAVTDNFVTIKA